MAKPTSLTHSSSGNKTCFLSHSSVPTVVINNIWLVNIRQRERLNLAIIFNQIKKNTWQAGHFLAISTVTAQRD